MVWDTYYGKQANPYNVEDFRTILAALEVTSDGSEAYEDLIRRTREALDTERSEV